MTTASESPGKRPAAIGMSGILEHKRAATKILNEGDPALKAVVEEFFRGQGTEPKLPNFEANFQQLLVKKKTHFNRPKEVIVNTIVRRLPARMIACSSVQQAADLYEDASCLPGASTAKHLMTQHKLTVNGPLYPRDEGTGPHGREGR
ncbi:hypothetical protein WJX79_007826 [Trebouxia sp. C0005]